MDTEHGGDQIPNSTTVQTKITYSPDRSKATIQVPPYPKDKSTSVVQLPEVHINTAGNHHQVSVGGDRVTFIHDREAYNKAERSQRDRANFREEKLRLQEEVKRRYKYWRDFSDAELMSIRKRMVSGHGQIIGMVNHDTDLEKLLLEQEEELRKLDLTNEQFASALHGIMETYIVAGKEGRLEQDEIGRFARKDRYTIYRYGEIGYQICPFGCETVRRFIYDYIVVDTNNKAFYFADIHPHLALHGFYEEPITIPVKGISVQEDQDEISTMSLGQMFGQVAGLIATSQGIQLRLQPHIQRGYRFINKPYDLPLQETAEFLRLKIFSERPE